MTPPGIIPHCSYAVPMAIVKHSNFEFPPPLKRPSISQELTVIGPIVIASYTVPVSRFHVPTTPKTLLNRTGYVQVFMLRAVYPHCKKRKDDKNGKRI